MQGQSSRGEYRVGPGASSLLLIFVAVCLTTIGILMLISAIADDRLSARSTAHVANYYEAATRTQREIGVLDGQLLNARKQAQGDAEVYKELVKNLTGDQIPMTVEAVDEDTMRISFYIPMSDSNRIECDLHVPVAFEGPRYVISRHVAANVADWVPEEDMELFGSEISGGGIFDIGAQSDDEEDEDGGIFDDEEDSDEEGLGGGIFDHEEDLGEEDSDEEGTGGGIFDVEESLDDEEGDSIEDDGIVGEGQSVQLFDDAEGE